MKKSYCAIHAHFYQPPRENAWTETIELQPSAAPFHDWNEKITHECYRPNAMARITDPKGRVLEMVNNFRMISFDVGPTLMSWLERHEPRVFQHIVEADRQSVKEHGGHGNALAQVYNHMIMPLANERDKITQVRWGIREFKVRYGRDPEGIWLPETAVNDDTLKILIDQKIKFTILAPHQAQKFRPIGRGDWQDVGQGQIDPSRPYRYFLEGTDRYLDLFFYDGAISHDLSFGDLAWDAQRMANRLEKARHPGRQHPELIHIATDGETYGHHKAFGDRVLAYVSKYEASARGFSMTNYGEYLEKFPPQYEIRIHPGPKGEGTSWSCVHGVGRWKENCGCQAGAQPGWNQNWRGPLRESFDLVRDKCAALFESEGRKLFKDPWEARNHYVDLVLDHSEEARRRFLNQFGSHRLNQSEAVSAMKLLEMQRHALLMYTSCGWFFSEISGIETVQVIQYASRAAEIAAEFGEKTITHDWFAKLAAAKSNLPSLADGRGVYERFVRPSRMTPERIIHHFAHFKKIPFHVYHVEEKKSWKESQKELEIRLSYVLFKPQATAESKLYVYALLRSGTYDFLCGVRAVSDPSEFDSLRREFARSLERGKEDLIGRIDRFFGPNVFRLKDLLLDEKRKISMGISREMLARFYGVYEKFYDDNRTSLEVFQQAKLPLPEEYRLAAEFVLNRRLAETIRKVNWEAPRPDYRAALAIAEEAKRWGFKLKSPLAEDTLSEILNQKVEKLSSGHSVKHLTAIEHILKASAKLGIELQNRMAQDFFFLFLQDYLPKAFEIYSRQRDMVTVREIKALLHLGRSLGFNMDRFRRRMPGKTRTA